MLGIEKSVVIGPKVRIQCLKQHLHLHLGEGIGEW